MDLHLYDKVHLKCFGKKQNPVCLIFLLPNLSAELHQTQPVPSQPLRPRPERRDGEKLVVDAQPGGWEEWKVPTPQGSLHGQQQQVHEEQRKSSKEKGNLLQKRVRFTETTL